MWTVISTALHKQIHVCTCSILLIVAALNLTFGAPEWSGCSTTSSSLSLLLTLDVLTSSILLGGGMEGEPLDGWGTAGASKAPQLAPGNAGEAGLLHQSWASRISCISLAVKSMTLSKLEHASYLYEHFCSSVECRTSTLWIQDCTSNILNFTGRPQHLTAKKVETA